MIHAGVRTKNEYTHMPHKMKYENPLEIIDANTHYNKLSPGENGEALNEEIKITENGNAVDCLRF